jgi:hypothetical protein
MLFRKEISGIAEKDRQQKKMFFNSLIRRTLAPYQPILNMSRINKEIILKGETPLYLSLLLQPHFNE